jgi:hypothetical protein
MATSFSGGRSRSTRREPPTMGKQLINFITFGCESSTPFFVTYKSRARTHAVLVIGLYELLGNPTTQLIEPPGPLTKIWYLFTPVSYFIILDSNSTIICMISNVEKILYIFTRITCKLFYFSKKFPWSDQCQYIAIVYFENILLANIHWVGFVLIKNVSKGR